MKRAIKSEYINVKTIKHYHACIKSSLFYSIYIIILYLNSINLCIF